MKCARVARASGSWFLLPGSPLCSHSPFSICENPSRSIKPQHPPDTPLRVPMHIHVQDCHFGCPLHAPCSPSLGCKESTCVLKESTWSTAGPLRGQGYLGTGPRPIRPCSPPRRAWPRVMSLTQAPVSLETRGEPLPPCLGPLLFLVLLGFC